MEPMKTMTNPTTLTNPTTPKKLRAPTMPAGAMLILLLLLLPLSGCFSLSRGAPGQTHYVLGGDGRAEVVPPGPMVETDSAAAAPAVIGLRPPALADYLSNAYIVVRRGAHQVGFSEFHRWGEDLARGVTRTLAGHLAARTPDHRVEAAPWPVSVRPARLVEVDVLRFEGAAPEDTLATDGEAHLLATWEILDAGGARLTSGTTEVRSDWTVGNFGELVGLLDAALDVLAADLVLGLERVPPPLEARDPPSRRDPP